MISDDTPPAPQSGRYLDAGVRTDLYVLLSHLLLHPPSGDLMRQLAELNWDPEIVPSLSDALVALQEAAGSCSRQAVQHEFEALFIGMGRGEVVPYASWYLEKLLMGAPLVRLRTDLAKMQISRQEKIYEPEDHAAALCETMALIIRDSRIPVVQQANFFNRHMQPWLAKFFRDLQQAPSARFYRVVGSLGEYFMRMENEHLQTQ